MPAPMLQNADKQAQTSTMALRVEQSITEQVMYACGSLEQRAQAVLLAKPDALKVPVRTRSGSFLKRRPSQKGPELAPTP